MKEANKAQEEKSLYNSKNRTHISVPLFGKERNRSKEIMEENNKNNNNNNNNNNEKALPQEWDKQLQQYILIILHNINLLKEKCNEEPNIRQSTSSLFDTCRNLVREAKLNLPNNTPTSDIINNTNNMSNMFFFSQLNTQNLQNISLDSLPKNTSAPQVFVDPNSTVATNKSSNSSNKTLQGDTPTPLTGLNNLGVLPENNVDDPLTENGNDKVENQNQTKKIIYPSSETLQWPSSANDGGDKQGNKDKNQDLQNQYSNQHEKQVNTNTNPENNLIDASSDTISDVTYGSDVLENLNKNDNQDQSLNAEQEKLQNKDPKDPNISLEGNGGDDSGGSTVLEKLNKDDNQDQYPNVEQEKLQNKDPNISLEAKNGDVPGNKGVHKVGDNDNQDDSTNQDQGQINTNPNASNELPEAKNGDVPGNKRLLNAEDKDDRNDPTNQDQEQINTNSNASNKLPEAKNGGGSNGNEVLSVGDENEDEDEESNEKKTYKKAKKKTQEIYNYTYSFQQPKPVFYDFSQSYIDLENAERLGRKKETEEQKNKKEEERRRKEEEESRKKEEEESRKKEEERRKKEGKEREINLFVEFISQKYESIFHSHENVPTNLLPFKVFELNEGNEDQKNEIQSKFQRFIVSKTNNRITELMLKSTRGYLFQKCVLLEKNAKSELEAVKKVLTEEMTTGLTKAKVSRDKNMFLLFNKFKFFPLFVSQKHKGLNFTPSWICENSTRILDKFNELKQQNDNVLHRIISNQPKWLKDFVPNIENLEEHQNNKNKIENHENNNNNNNNNNNENNSTIDSVINEDVNEEDWKVFDNQENNESLDMSAIPKKFDENQVALMTPEKGEKEKEEKDPSHLNSQIFEDLEKEKQKELEKNKPIDILDLDEKSDDILKRLRLNMKDIFDNNNWKENKKNGTFFDGFIGDINNFLANKDNLKYDNIYKIEFKRYLASAGKKENWIDSHLIISWLNKLRKKIDDRIILRYKGEEEDEIADFDLDKTDQILIIVWVGRNHFVVLNVKRSNKNFEVHFYDSLHDELKGIYLKLAKEKMTKYLKRTLKQKNINWIVKETPQQSNYNDCGVFSMHCCYLLSFGISVNEFSCEDIEFIRKKMLCETIYGDVLDYSNETKIKSPSSSSSNGDQISSSSNNNNNNNNNNEIKTNEENSSDENLSDENLKKNNKRTLELEQEEDLNNPKKKKRDENDKKRKIENEKQKEETSKRNKIKDDKEEKKENSDDSVTRNEQEKKEEEITLEKEQGEKEIEKEKEEKEEESSVESSVPKKEEEKEKEEKEIEKEKEEKEYTIEKENSSLKIFNEEELKEIGTISNDKLVEQAICFEGNKIKIVYYYGKSEKVECTIENVTIHAAGKAVFNAIQQKSKLNDGQLIKSALNEITTTNKINEINKNNNNEELKIDENQLKELIPFLIKKQQVIELQTEQLKKLKDLFLKPKRQIDISVIEAAIKLINRITPETKRELIIVEEGKKSAQKTVNLEQIEEIEKKLFLFIFKEKQKQRFSLAQIKENTCYFIGNTSSSSIEFLSSLQQEKECEIKFCFSNRISYLEDSFYILEWISRFSCLTENQLATFEKTFGDIKHCFKQRFELLFELTEQDNKKK